MIKQSNLNVLNTFKSLLKKQRFSSKLQLADALSLSSIGSFSSTRVSILIGKIGVIKVRDFDNELVDSLLNCTNIPQKKQVIASLALDVKNNGVQIIIKIVIGSATLLSKMIDSLRESIGVLGCIANDDTILIIPTDVKHIDDTARMIIEYLDIEI